MMMPRLKYHNPTVPISVSKQLEPLRKELDPPVFLNIHMNKSLSSSESNVESKHFIFDREKKIIPASAESANNSVDADSSSAPTKPSTANSTFQAVRPAILDNPITIFRQTKSTPLPAENERIVQVPIQSRSAQEIWADFLQITNATQLEPTEGELQAMKELEERKKAREVKPEEKQSLREAIKQAQLEYNKQDTRPRVEL